MMPVYLLLLVLIEEGTGRDVVQFSENSRHRLINKQIQQGIHSNYVRFGGWGNCALKMYV